MRASDEASGKFYELLWPHRDTVLRTARFLMHDPIEADDLVQDTMLKAFKAIGSFRPGTDARAWLLAILRNARIDRLRSAASRRNDLSLDLMPTEPADRNGTSSSVATDPSDAARLLEQFSDADVIVALQDLPEEIRWTLLLVDVEEMDQADAAAILDVPVGTVKSRAHRGRGMLREALAGKAREMKLVP